jgi:hypothetical protein
MMPSRKWFCQGNPDLLGLCEECTCPRICIEEKRRYYHGEHPRNPQRRHDDSEDFIEKEVSSSGML